MIMSLLKFVAVILVAVFMGALWIVQFTFTLLRDGSVQAKEATPGVVEEVKSHVATEAANFPNKFAAIENNVRRLVRIPKRTKVEVREVLQLSA